MSADKVTTLVKNGPYGETGRVMVHEDGKVDVKFGELTNSFKFTSKETAVLFYEEAGFKVK